ncbi:MAG: tRNA (adenosine(37)-N6)-threonylcarbamoyltransferase complex ATPase subunit type 1 TsaE [Acidimicrobiales bacterium]
MAGPQETQEVAARLAGLLSAGDVVLLGGELGAGKTTFTKGLAAALGVAEVVTSPTFTLLRSYPAAGGLTLLHADVYRLGQLREVLDLALTEQLDEGAVAVVEWGERAAPALGPDYLSITFGHGAGETDRTLLVRAVGQAWAGRAAALAAGEEPPPPARP